MPKENRKCPCGAPLLPGKGPRKYCPTCKDIKHTEHDKARKAKKKRSAIVSRATLGTEP
jgi:uncharacterized Zn finger protein (UPF0148 family)